MRTVEELEAALELVTRERDLSLAAWESAGMTGRTAQSAMLELARQLEEARDTIVALTTAMAEKDLEIATLTTALDERDLEAERGLEQYDRIVRERDEARAEVERLTDERDELLVRVAEQGAELRATREAYIGAKWTNAYRRGAEAMREACARVADAHFVPGTRDVIHALPIPEEP
jgi:chromosome segregation ATPase